MRWFNETNISFLTKHLRLWHQVVREQSILEMMRSRVLIACGLFSLGFMVIAIRLWDVMIWNAHDYDIFQGFDGSVRTTRANIMDRNGEIIATHIPTASVYANPNVILNAPQAVVKLTSVFRELNPKVLLKKLTSDKKFVWITRHITPKQQKAINEMGIPGIYLQNDEKRIYPHGHLFSHVVGYCGIDNTGLAGVERFFDKTLNRSVSISKGDTLDNFYENEDLNLSLDVRAQYILYDELSEAIKKHKAKGGNAILMDIKTGEIIAMVSLPDFDPNNPPKKSEEKLFNRNTAGRYEHGSIFKILNVANALESGKIGLKSRYDASMPLKIGRYKVTDFAGKNCVLNVLQGFIYSSNIVSAKMALDFGPEHQKTLFKRYGLLDKPNLELPEVVGSLIPKTWTESAAMTLSYGYGIAVTPLQLVNAVGGIINDGYLQKPTILKKEDHDHSNADQSKIKIVSLATSQHIRNLMRLAVLNGTVKKADVVGFDVIGKTGTAYKNAVGGYKKSEKQTSCITAFPGKEPRYILFVSVDQPQPSAQTYGYATGGWIAAPAAANIIKRVAPILNITPTSTPFDPLDNKLYSQLYPIQSVQYLANIN